MASPPQANRSKRQDGWEDTNQLLSTDSIAPPLLRDREQWLGATKREAVHQQVDHPYPSWMPHHG